MPSYGLAVLTLLQLALYHFRAKYEHKYKYFGVAFCPRCNSQVERSQVIDKALPKKCNNCGLHVQKCN